MKSKSISLGSAIALPFCVMAFILLLACEIESGNETVRNVSVQVAGTYRNSSGIPARQSGNRITSLTISQSGDQLFAIDNQGGRWTGSIGRADNQVASVTLRGMTSAGGEVVITGNITVSGSTGVLSGMWVEPGYTSELFAEAGNLQPAPAPTQTPVPGITPTPTPFPNQISGNSNAGSNSDSGLLIQI